MNNDNVRKLGRFQEARRLILAILIAAAFIVLVFTGSRHDELTHEHIETLGLTLILVGIGGRLWSILYIGGRKTLEIVSTGPYSVTRNPLYFFSSIAAAGVGAQSGSYVVALIFLVLTTVAFYIVAFREERFLTHTFGADYIAYSNRVPRFLPNPLLYRDDTEVTFKTRRFASTLADGLVFLAAIPVLEGIEYAQEIGLAPVFIMLP